MDVDANAIQQDSVLMLDDEGDLRLEVGMGYGEASFHHLL